MPANNPPAHAPFVDQFGWKPALPINHHCPFCGGRLGHVDTAAWGILIVCTNDNCDYDIPLDIVKEAHRRNS